MHGGARGRASSGERWLLLRRWRRNAGFGSLVVANMVRRDGGQKPLTGLSGPGIFCAGLVFVFGCWAPLSLHGVPVQGSHVESETLLLEPSEGALDIAVVFVTKLCHFHSTD